METEFCLTDTLTQIIMEDLSGCGICWRIHKKHPCFISTLVLTLKNFSGVVLVSTFSKVHFGKKHSGSTVHWPFTDQGNENLGSPTLAYTVLDSKWIVGSHSQCISDTGERGRSKDLSYVNKGQIVRCFQVVVLGACWHNCSPLTSCRICCECLGATYNKSFCRTHASARTCFGGTQGTNQHFRQVWSWCFYTSL